MGGFRGIYLSGLAATVGLLLCGAASAQAVDITSATSGTAFTPGPFSQAQGVTANFVNQDEAGPVSYHNVTASQGGPDGDPLFSSETILGGGLSTPVVGTQYLSAGSYPFVCTLHSGMNGTLEVTPEGTPVPRPGVKLTVPSQKLKQVRKSGKLKIKVTPVAPSTGVDIAVFKGRKVIGEIEIGKVISIKTVTVKLTKSGRAAIKKGKKVKFSVSAEVPWGKTARTNRTLR